MLGERAGGSPGEDLVPKIADERSAAGAVAREQMLGAATLAKIAHGDAQEHGDLPLGELGREVGGWRDRNPPRDTK